MSKKVKLGIVAAIVLVLVALVIPVAKDYYDNRYVGSTYYARVPESYDTTPRTILSDAKEDMGKGVIYNLRVYNEAGDEKEVQFTRFEEDQSIIDPGTYLQLEVSESSISQGEEVITKDEVPKALQSKLE
ncbi:hypothetical protein A4S06_09225 [Erysipelotrichaceae bacterium MTC7]|nr:hypothetical protein A4S06_09225 [Erysipelotrichaceae bacterium MTC7]